MGPNGTDSLGFITVSLTCVLSVVPFEPRNQLLIQVSKGYESVVFPLGFSNSVVLAMLLLTNVSVLVLGA